MSLLTIRVKQGLLQGIKEEGYTVFKGIPYAQPPIHHLRFKRPQPAACWEGIRQAKQFSPRSMQLMHPPGSFYDKEFYGDPCYLPPMSEDCLYLNVWTPALTPDERLPVAFWIHGGGFLGGYGSEMEFDGAAYCRRKVILVTINYRTGPFGFLAHPWLSAESPQGLSGNDGLFDQIAALEWVRDNIASFGGDADQITVFGQSAGAISTQILVSSELAKPLIQGAIMQSGGGYKAGLLKEQTLAEAEKTGEAFVNICKVNSLSELRALPADKILKALRIFMADKGKTNEGLPFGPNMDGYLLTCPLDILVDKGQHKDIPYLLGSTKNDIGVNINHLAQGDKGPLYDACIAWSLKNEALGRRPSYVYYFARDLPGDDQASAFHSAELWYMFGTLKRSWRPFEPADEALSERMLDYWCNFIKNKNPNQPGLPDWNPCSSDDPFVKILM